MTKWIPKVTGGKYYTSWHAKDHHGVSIDLGGRSSVTVDAEHDQLHADNVFKDGVEHKHWEPKTSEQRKRDAHLKAHLENKNQGNA